MNFLSLLATLTSTGMVQSTSTTYTRRARQRTLSRCSSCMAVCPPFLRISNPLTNVIGPGHFLEVSKILPLLTAEGDHPSFNVVALSLPGFGFSEAPKKPGFGIRKFAEVSHACSSLHVPSLTSMRRSDTSSCCRWVMMSMVRTHPFDP